jgi:hypothetical protein
MRPTIDHRKKARAPAGNAGAIDFNRGGIGPESRLSWSNQIIKMAESQKTMACSTAC